MILSNKLIKKELIRLHGYAGWSMPVLFVNPEDTFSGVEAHIRYNSFLLNFYNHFSTISVFTSKVKF